MEPSKLIISFSNIKDVQLIPNKEFSLNADDISIYSIYLPNFIDIISDLAKFINSDEINRASRFYKESDRNRFIICRSLLRFVLAAYTKLDTKSININYHFNKKPYLASHPGLFFNISHSQDCAVIAISSNKIGIDIEYISEDFNFTNLIPDIFNDKEISAIQNAVNKKQTFYTSWTRKEAFAKALGKGIDDDFKNIPSLDGQHSIDSILVKATENWQVHSFNLKDHYLGAVAFDSSSTISKNLVLHPMPHTMECLLQMTQKKSN